MTKSATPLNLIINRVVISRVEETANDPILDNFLSFLAKDMENKPIQMEAITSDVVNRA